jgi:formate dehydrogenase iron-sulfur subunit
MREQVGVNHGVYDNPIDLTPASFTVMRFSEWINPESDNLEWLIRKELHACEDPAA